jgi:AraC family transcriptional regulator
MHHQLAQYDQRIGRAVDLLERQVRNGEPPSAAELAEAAAMSLYHFHRIFRLMTGETANEATTRVRLAASLPALRDRGIMAGSGQSGYATSQAYARALKAATGESPRDVWRSEERFARATAHLSQRREDAPLQLSIVDLAPLRLLTIRNVGAYERLNVAYERLFGLVLEQVEPDAIAGIWGLPYDDPRAVPAEECRFDCGLAVGEQGHATGELLETRVEGGLYAEASLVGDYDLVHDRLDALYRALIDADVPVRDAPLVIAYLDDPEEVPAERQRAMVYLAVEG